MKSCNVLGFLASCASNLMQCFRFLARSITTKTVPSFSYTLRISCKYSTFFLEMGSIIAVKSDRVVVAMPSRLICNDAMNLNLFASSASKPSGDKLPLSKDSVIFAGSYPSSVPMGDYLGGDGLNVSAS